MRNVLQGFVSSRSEAHAARRAQHLTATIAPAADVTYKEWRLIRTSRANVLVEGADVLTEALVRALTPSLRPPVHAWHGGVPPARPATLLVADVAALSIADQKALFGWINVTDEPRRVISTSSTAVFPLLEQGRFHADLYYCLNVVLLRLR